MGDAHLGEGVDGIVHHLLPGDHQNGIVQVILYLAALENLHIRREQSLLAVQQRLRFFQKPS